MPAVRRPRRLTLQAQLVTSIVVLFTLATAAIAALTIARLHDSQLGQLDAQLRLASQSLQGGASGGPGGDSQVGGGNSLRLDMRTDGTLLARHDPETGVERSAATVSRPDGEVALTSAQVTRLKTAGLGSTPRELDLGGDLGTYRLVAVEHLGRIGDGSGAYVQGEVVTIVGLPTAPAQYTVRHTALSIGLLSVGGLLIVGVATSIVVSRATRPLRRVAATATQVANLPLSTGEVQMQERVPARDADSHTEVGQVGAALNEMLDHIDHALTARQRSEMQVRQFVADASHELRTPLASIRGYAELSRREREPVPPGVTHALGRIESEAGRMTTLVEDLLLLARLDSGRPLAQEPVDLSMLVIETVSDLHAAGPDHVWNLNLPDDAVEVVGDEARLRQVLINLLANARKHTPPGTTVTTGVEQDAQVVRVTVSDNGPGIPPDLLPHVFERFTRGDEARTRTEGSTGLGLSIVSAVVAANHGRVDVRSGPDGTCFTIELPAHPDRTSSP